MNTNPEYITGTFNCADVTTPLDELTAAKTLLRAIDESFPGALIVVERRAVEAILTALREWQRESGKTPEF